jgi:ABC-type transporter Mla MlaB component
MVSRVTPQLPAVAPAAHTEHIHWTCPPVLSLDSLTQLVSVLRQTAPPWNLDWRALQSVQEEAVEPLYRQLAILADQPMHLGFLGARHLENFLRDATPSGERSVAQPLWLLYMAVLRILRRPDDFELVALNYCVTYEVSPPAWEAPQCGFTALDGDVNEGANSTIVGDVHESRMLTTGGAQSEFATTSAEEGEDTGFAALTVDLAGQIMGDATVALDLLNNKLGDAEEMVISCAGLIRVDFSAAGTLLNWVSTRHAHGKRVHFSDAHRLVAAFFGVIGISELASVTTRKD